MRARVLPVLLFIPLILCACASTERSSLLPPLQVVPQVDLKRYAGTWFEIARYPHRFQEGCIGSSATYTLLEDGTVDVLNQCRRGPAGEISSAKGKARVADSKTNARLKVTFFWPFSGAYWIIDLGEKYDYAVVGHPSRKYLWILSRTPQMDDNLYRQILLRLAKQGYDTERLIRAETGNQRP